jgi:hypothetical protein
LPSVTQGAGLAAHCHLTWFGWELTLPAPDHDHSSQDGDAGFRPVIGAVLVRLVDEQPTAPQAKPIAWACIPVTSANNLYTIVEAGAARSIQRAASMAIAAPLCDAARHERSGVQLI